MNLDELTAPLITRRTVLGAGAGLALGSLLANTTSASTPVASPAADTVNGIQPDGTWAFTDDRGVTARVPTTPSRVIVDVNVAGALWDFGVRPVGVFGWNITGENTVGPAGGNLDTSTVEFLNGPSTTIDAERAIAAQPDLIVSLYFGPEFGVWSILPEETERIEQIAPIVAISGTSRADIALGRFAELAGALGIDLESEEIAAQRATYETSIARLKGVLSVKTGMSAVFVATDTDSVWVANPAAAGDVMFFRELGLDVPGLPVSDAEYWQQLSFEEVAIYPTDLFFYSLRGVINTKEGILEHPTMGLLPSAKAGQVFPWNQDVILNYPGLAGILDGISTAVETSDENTV